MRFGFADPPYLGLAASHYGEHPDYAGEVDHAALIEQLEADYDGWALCASLKSIPALARILPLDVLTLSWVKPIAPPMGDRRHYSWEPVFLRPCRPPALPTRMHLVYSPPMFTFRERPAEHVIGEKPEPFCRWVFLNAGLMVADELEDLFPGSGAVGRAWDQYQRKATLL